MNISLDPEVQRVIDERIKSGQFSRPEDVIAAALMTMQQQEWACDFEPGELDFYLAEGEQSITTEGTLDGEEAFLARKNRRLNQE